MNPKVAYNHEVIRPSLARVKNNPHFIKPLVTDIHRYQVKNELNKRIKILKILKIE